MFFHHPNNLKGPGRPAASVLGWFVLLPIVSMAGPFPLRLHAQPAQGQISYEGEKVGFVDLVVRPGVDAEALYPLILQKEGEPYSQEKVQNSIAAQASGKVQQGRCRSDARGDRVARGFCGAAGLLRRDDLFSGRTEGAQLFSLVMQGTTPVRETAVHFVWPRLTSIEAWQCCD